MDFFLRGSDQLVKETYEFMRKHMQRVEVGLPGIFLFLERKRKRTYQKLTVN
jgi:hypothetical protein